MRPPTIRQRLEVIRDRHYRSHECIGPCNDCRTCREAVLCIEALDQSEHAKLIISRERGPWRLVRDPESSA